MNWHIIYTKSRFEKKVETDLLEKGYEVYCPKRRYIKNWSDRKKKVEEVLFKSYLFVLIKAHQKVDVLQTNGVVKFVHFKGELATIRQADIDKIKSMLNDFDNQAISIEAIYPGDMIEIKSGILMGHNAQILRKQGTNTLVFIEALGAKLIIDVSKNINKKIN